MPFSALVLFAALGSAVSQPQAARAPMELSFDRATAKAGEPVALPIYLVSDTSYPTPFQVTLEFPGEQLTFQKVEPDYLAERARWTISAAVSEHPDKPERRILRIDITPGASTFFPSGLVAHAHFIVSEDNAGGDIPLDAALIAPLGATPVPATEPAKITVLTTALFGCFFYMH